MTPLRRSLAAALVIAGLWAGAPAWAGTYYYCYLENPYADQGYVYTPVMKTSLDSIDEHATGYKFYEYAQSHVTYDAGGSVRATCASTGTADSIQKSHAYHIEKYGGIEVEWTDSPLPPEPVEETVSKGALVIEEAEPLTEAPEVLAARALAEERRRAAAMAKVLVENARRDAELDAKLQETIRRDKRRGRMQ
jgi:hypothetical protein